MSATTTGGRDAGSRGAGSRGAGSRGAGLPMVIGAPRPPGAPGGRGGAAPAGFLAQLLAARLDAPVQRARRRAAPGEARAAYAAPPPPAPGRLLATA